MVPWHPPRPTDRHRLVLRLQVSVELPFKTKWSLDVHHVFIFLTVSPLATCGKFFGVFEVGQSVCFRCDGEISLSECSRLRQDAEREGALFGQRVNGCLSYGG